jgi:hypothetical protein
MGQKEASIFFHGASDIRENPIAMGALLFGERPFIRGIRKEAIIKGLSLLFSGPLVLVPKGSRQLHFTQGPQGRLRPCHATARGISIETGGRNGITPRTTNSIFHGRH